MKILMVLTSHDKLGDTGLKTGFWLEEFASPYFVFKDHSFEVTLASPQGGQPPLDPKSEAPDFQTAATVRFRKDDQAQKALANTLRLDLIKADDYDAIFYPGGHGPLWDLAENKNSISLIENFYQKGKPLGLVCHAPGVLRHARNAEKEPLVKGKKVTGFSNTEEDAVQLTEVVPFLVEDMLKENKGVYCKGEDWGSFVARDENLVTGQNPASSEAAALCIVELLDR
jgi:putative intracellular protease/amidase